MSLWPRSSPHSMDLMAFVVYKTLFIAIPIDSLTFLSYGERGRTEQDTGLGMKKGQWDVS